MIFMLVAPRKQLLIYFRFCKRVERLSSLLSHVKLNLNVKSNIFIWPQPITKILFRVIGIHLKWFLYLKHKSIFVAYTNVDVDKYANHTIR